MKNSSKLAVCSIITALSVVLMFLGGITFVLAYAIPMIVGLFMIMLRTTFGASAAWITYAATSLLSFILVADRECMLMYVMFFGFYPIIQPRLSKIKITLLRIFAKLIIFNSLIAASQIILFYIFHIPFLENGEGKGLIIIFAVMMNLLFFIHDRLLTMLYKLYNEKFEKRIKKLLK